MMTVFETLLPMQKLGLILIAVAIIGLLIISRKGGK